MNLDQTSKLARARGGPLLSIFTLTLRAEVNRVYSDSQSQFLLKVFTACVVKSTPNINQEILFSWLQKERIDDI